MTKSAATIASGPSHSPEETGKPAATIRTEPAASDTTTEERRGGASTDQPTGLGVGAAAIGLGAMLAAGVGRQLTATPPMMQRLSGDISRMLNRLIPGVVPLQYSRHDDSDPLKHDTRAAIFDAIDDSPGLSLTELSEQTNVSISTLRHHLRVLEREDLIASERVRGSRRVYPAYTEPEAIELAAALNDEATAPIVNALARLNQATVSDLAEAIDRDDSTVTHHLQHLEEKGLVVRERNGRTIVNRLTAEVREALITIGETDATSDPPADDAETSRSAG